MTDTMTLSGDYLCTVDFEVAGGLMSIGTSPWGEQRMGYITGGAFDGPRLSGIVLPGGGNWSRAGRIEPDRSVGTFDARAVWQTHDGALIQVTYTGRSVIPDPVRAAFADPAAQVDPALYYLRIAPVFECADARYAWLNGILAVGIGERTTRGARHRIFAVR
jgi:hypothetical protein